MAFFQGYYANQYKFTLITTSKGDAWLSYVYDLNSGQLLPSGWSQPTMAEALAYARDIIEHSESARAASRGHRWNPANFEGVWAACEEHNFTPRAAWDGPEKLDEAEEARKDHDAAEARATEIVQLLGEYARCTDPRRKKFIRVELRKRGHYLSQHKA